MRHLCAYIRLSFLRLLTPSILLTLAWNTANSGQASFQYVNTLLWQGISSFVVRDNVAYCLNAQGVRLIDISDRSAPAELSQFHWECVPVKIALASSHLLVIDEWDRLTLVAVEPDWSLSKLGSLQLDAWPNDLEVVGEYVFVLDGNTGDGFYVNVIDISAPQSLVVVRREYVGNWGRSLARWGSRLYIGTGSPTNSVIFWEISDPAVSHFVGSLTNLGEFRSLAVRNDTLYIIGDTPDFQAWDCRNPGYPKQISTFDSPSRPALAGLLGARVLLGNFDKSLRIVDITVPTAPATDSFIANAGAGGALCIEGADAFIGDGRNAKAISFADPENPQWVFDLSVAGFPTDLELLEGTLFVAHGDSGVLALDISDVAQPSALWQWSVPQCNNNNCDAQLLKSASERLYCNFKDGILRVFDLNGTGMLEPIAQLGAPWNGSICGSLNGDTLVMTGTDGTVSAVNFSNPAAPTELAFIRGPQHIGLAIRDNTIAVTKKDWAGYSGAQINLGLEFLRLDEHLEVAEQSSFSDFPEFCYWENPPGEDDPPGIFCQPTGPENAVLLNSLLLANSPTGGLMAFEITNLEAPAMTFLQHRYPPLLADYFGDLAVDDEFVFVSRSGAIEVFDLSEGFTPVLLDTIQVHDYIYDLVAAKNQIFAATSTGVVVFQRDQAVSVNEEASFAPSELALYQNHPNPFNAGTTISFDLGRPSFVTAKIMNVLGQRVRTLIETSLPAGRHVIEWDGRDQLNKPMASGVYFYQIKAGDFESTRKMLLLK